MIGAVTRMLMSTSFCMLMYLCWCGFLPVFTSFLDLRAFQVLGKLNYSMFMMHYLVLWYNLGTTRQPIEVSFYALGLDVIGVYAISTFIGFFVYIFVEAPGFSLLKLAFAERRLI